MQSCLSIACNNGCDCPLASSDHGVAPIRGRGGGGQKERHQGERGKGEQAVYRRTSTHPQGDLQGVAGKPRRDDQSPGRFAYFFSVQLETCLNDFNHSFVKFWERRLWSLHFKRSILIMYIYTNVYCTAFEWGYSQPSQPQRVSRLQWQAEPLLRRFINAVHNYE